MIRREFQHVSSARQEHRLRRQDILVRLDAERLVHMRSALTRRLGYSVWECIKADNYLCVTSPTDECLLLIANQRK